MASREAIVERYSVSAETVLTLLPPV